MKTILFSALLVAMATSTSAQSIGGFEGARLGFEYDMYDDGEGFTVDVAEISADVSLLVGGNVGFQLGLGYAKEVGSSDPFLDFRNTNAFELHGFYDFSDQIRVAAIYAPDSYNEGDYFYGFEGIYAAGDLRIEARAGVFDSEYEPAKLYEVHGAYQVIDDLRLRAIARRVDYDDDYGHYNLLSLGASYDVMQNVTIYGDYGWHENDFGFGDVYNGNLITVGMSISFGGPQNDKMFTYSPFY